VKPDSIDKKDQKEILNSLLAFWDLKKTYSQKEEYTEGFATAMRDALKQSRTGVLSYETKIPRSDYDDVSPKLGSKKKDKKKGSPVYTTTVTSNSDNLYKAPEITRKEVPENFEEA
jgi:hypothetical protein